MKFHLLCLALLLLTAAAPALDEVRIEEVGLRGYYSTGTATPVRVQVSASSPTGPVQLDFTVTSGDPDSYQPVRTDHFSKQLSVNPGETVQVELPILLAGTDRSTLELSVSDSNGRKIGSSSVIANARDLVNTQTLIAILCQDHRLCDEAQSQISFGGSEEETSQKNNAFRFVTLPNPREHWWDYSAARFVVVADSMRAWTPEQKAAVEYYLRSGGELLLLEKEADDSNFLAAYPRKEGKADPLHVGNGKLYRVTDLRSKELSSLFTGDSYKKISAGASPSVRPFYGNATESWMRRRVGVSFDFPRLRWVLIWLGTYVLLAGLVNFTLLRRWRRLEWGWMTTTCIAVLFAGGLYVASSMRRPKNVTLDDVVIYSMDSRSPVAYEQIGLRVSSPDRMATSISVGDDGVVDTRNSAPSETTNAEIATEITQSRRMQAGWQMKLGPPPEIGLSLLRWSFVDLDLQTFHVFAGPVILTPDLHLKNNTGQQFGEAMYLDFAQNRKYFMPGLASGQEIDIRSMVPTAIWRDVSTPNGKFAMRQAVMDPTVPDRGPLSLKGVPYYGLQWGAGTHFFVGLSDRPAPDTSLTGVHFVRQNVALTAVALDPP